MFDINKGLGNLYIKSIIISVVNMWITIRAVNNSQLFQQEIHLHEPIAAFEKSWY